MDFVITAPERPVLPVVGTTALFPVRRVYCVARNYAAHAREMGADPAREPPFFFAKPGDAAVPDGSEIPYPPATADLQHEVELVAAIGRGGANIAQDRALNHVFGYAVGIDLTRRDLQATAKAAGHPWDMAKGFDASAPCSRIRPATGLDGPGTATISLSVNGAERQRGSLSDMIWSVAEIVALLSRLVTLAPGDLIMTGTPEGVGRLERGDRVEAGIDGIGTLGVTIA